MPEKCLVLGLPVHLSSSYSNLAIERLEQKLATHIVTLNAEMAMLGEKDAKMGKIIKAADLVIPDGSGVVFYLAMRGHKQKRVPGIELAQTLIEEVATKGSIAFYGGKPEIIKAAVNFWQERIPGISLLFSDGYIDEEGQKQWCQTLQKEQPKLILVGLGVPRQEYWIAEHRHICPNSIWIGVGGSFDIWSGTKIRAPRLFRENNLEWLYRLYQEPWRWRRMLVLPKFFLRSFVEH
jgi:N-acetylglucosaminyldiphosphoundecaprenol N-acetyl-beta-D-mannosaminyltransferase